MNVTPDKKITLSEVAPLGAKMVYPIVPASVYSKSSVIPTGSDSRSRPT